MMTLLSAATIVIFVQGEKAELARRLGFDIKETRKLATCKCLHPGEGKRWPRNVIECSNGEDFACDNQQECFNSDPFVMPLTKDNEVIDWIKDTGEDEWHQKCPTTAQKDMAECMTGEFCNVKTDPLGEKCCWAKGGKRKCPLGTTMCRNPVLKDEDVGDAITKTWTWTCAGPGMQFPNCDLVGGNKQGSDCQNYACPTTTDSHDYQCMDGSKRNVPKDGWRACEGVGGRARCPKFMFMCAEKNCDGDYCCKKSLADCGFKVRRDCPSYKQKVNPGSNPDTSVCRYFNPDGMSFNQVMQAEGRNFQVVRDLLASSKETLKHMGYEPFCPTKEEILQTPLAGKSGNDRKKRWQCFTCDCGCHIPYGASTDESKPDWVPACTQSKGNWRFPFPHAAAGHAWNQAPHAPKLSQPPMIETLSNFANDAGQEEFTWTAPKDAFVSGFWTERVAYAKDRVFKFHTKNFDSYLTASVAHTDTYTTAWCNTKDSGNAPDGNHSPMMACRCRAGYAVIGFESKFNEGVNDRKWKLQCGKLPGTRILNKLPSAYRHTGAVNHFGDDPRPNHHRDESSDHRTGNKVCFHDEVVCGLYGHHLDNPHDDRIYGIECCRLQIAAQQCTVVQIEITDQIVHSVNQHASKTHADKISVNNCGNPQEIKNTLGHSHAIELQKSSTFELSESLEKSFSMSVSAEVSLSFTKTTETPFQEAAGGITTEFSMGLTVGTEASWSKTTTKSQTKIEFQQKTETETFEKGFEYGAPANTRLTVTATSKEYEGQIYWTGLAKCMYNAGGQLVTLETKSVSGSWSGAQVRQGDLKFEVKTCASDGFKLEEERYCTSGDRLTDENGDYLSFETMHEAKQACEKNEECSAVFDEGCTNDGSEAIMLCKKNSFLEFSKHSCVLVKTAAPIEAPKCPVGFDGPCKETQACPAELEEHEGKVYCSASWKADCNEDCVKENCAEAGGTYINHGEKGVDRAAHHFVCEVPAREPREECSCVHAGLSRKIKCTDGHETVCAEDEYCSNSMSIHKATVHFETKDCVKDEETDRCRGKKHICAPVESAVARALRGDAF